MHQVGTILSDQFPYMHDLSVCSVYVIQISKSMLFKCVLLVFCYHQLLGGAVSEFTPTVYPAKISSQCGQPLNDDEQLLESLQQVEQQLPNHYSSCKCIYNADPSSSSGYYNITIANGSVVQVYCDMEGTNCGGEGGWTRVTYINMTQAGDTCPVGLYQRSFNNKSYCGNTGSSGCNGTMFPTLVEYSRVCGRVRGYQYGALIAFELYNFYGGLTIDDNYVDGVSITYGSAPRKHIWTYAAALYDHNNTYYGYYDCPCKQNNTIIAPPFIGTDYYCESGTTICCQFIFYLNDPLWDGQQCGTESLCCTHPNMPWFIKTLNETTTENTELRVCDVGALYYDTDIPLDLIEVLVQ